MKALQLASKNYHIVYSQYNRKKDKKEKKVKGFNISSHHFNSGRISSVGRTLDSRAGGRGFDIPRPEQYSGSENN